MSSCMRHVQLHASCPYAQLIPSCMRHVLRVYVHACMPCHASDFYCSAPCCLLSDDLLLLAQPVCCALSVIQVPCYDACGCPTLVGLRGVGDTSPARGRPVANVLLCLGCVSMFSGNSLPCMPRRVPAAFASWAWSVFPTGGGAPGLSLFCGITAAMSSYHASQAVQ
jgi:hypothetical protein